MGHSLITSPQSTRLKRIRQPKRQPIIGISCYVGPVDAGDWSYEASYIPNKYIEETARAGGCPVLIPPLPEEAIAASERCDGLILSGGPDIVRPEENAIRARSTSIVWDRDRTEIAILSYAMARNAPVLGICRGMQLINLFAGGTLVEHLPDVSTTVDHCPAPGRFAQHVVRTEPNSMLGSVLGEEVPVKSHHHQAPARLGQNLRVAARAEDATVEALEHTKSEFVVGVLWHPEEEDREEETHPLFQALVSCASLQLQLKENRR